MQEKIYLLHIFDEIKKIGLSIEGMSKSEFERNSDIQDATLRRIEVIGEAVKNIPTSFKNKHPKIAWKKIAGTRDVLIHAYFSVDLNLIWGIVKDDLPVLKKQIEEILSEENS